MAAIQIEWMKSQTYWKRSLDIELKCGSGKEVHLSQRNCRAKLASAEASIHYYSYKRHAEKLNQRSNKYSKATRNERNYANAKCLIELFMAENDKVRWIFIDIVSHVFSYRPCSHAYKNVVENDYIKISANHVIR